LFLNAHCFVCTIAQGYTSVVKIGSNGSSKDQAVGATLSPPTSTTTQYSILSELNLNTEAEQLLIETLFKNYNKKVRPPGTIQVKFALNLNQIVNLIEKDQIIVLNAFVDHEWTDLRLSWSNFFLKNIRKLNY
jgi:hypothetical protein